MDNPLDVEEFWEKLNSKLDYINKHNEGRKLRKGIGLF